MIIIWAIAVEIGQSKLMCPIKKKSGNLVKKIIFIPNFIKIFYDDYHVGHRG